jgi:hypothetical protein
MGGYSRKIYCLRVVGSDGRIKIGCSVSPQSRLTEYVRWSPFPLEIVFEVPGDFQLERRVQKYLSDTHLHHEWFGASERTDALISAMAAGQPLDEFLPADLPDHPDKPARVIAYAKRKPSRKTKAA